MNRFKFSRQKISIQEIGVFKFLIGLFVGLSASVILSLFFNYGRESLRIFTSLRADLLIISDSAFQFYNYFFASFATTLGLCLCITIWFTGSKTLSRKTRIKQRLSLTYPLLTFGMAIMFVVRLGSLFTFLPLGLDGYEDHLNLIKQTGFILFLLPVNIFFIAWFQTRLVYKTGRWILYSIPVCIFIIVSLAKITAVDRSLVNNKYYYRLYETEFEYIDQQVRRAEELYQVKYSEKTLRTLEKWNTESSYNLVSDLKRSFESNRVVTIDSIILARIAVHTLKLDGKPDFNYQKNEFYWDYPLPSFILHQIKNFDSSSHEVIELVKLYGEEIKLINSHVISFGDSLELYDRKDFQRSAFLRNHLTENIYDEADSIRKVILMDSYLSVPDSFLPALNQNFRRPTFDDY
tara:strand:+ start:2310 stop:3527 length:1218 start_codon:yes stop_codon:yes gene_type:complete